MRELVTYSSDPLPAGMFLMRYDFAYRDPASGWPQQISVDVLIDADDLTQRDERIVPPARASIERVLKRKCGIKLAISNQIHLKLPVHRAARYV